MAHVNLAITAAAQYSDLTPLWQLVVLAICLAAALVLAAIVIIRRVTTASSAPHISEVALKQLEERRDRGEILEQQFGLARAMLLAATPHTAPAASGQAHRRQIRAHH